MPRIAPLDPETATGPSRELLDAVQQKLGFQPNLLKTMAQSPAALKMYLAMSEALSTTSLSAKVRESVALSIATVNGCEYCGAAHAAVGKAVGLDAGEIARNLHGQSGDPKTQASIDFALATVKKQGWLDSSDLDAARKAGLTEAELSELIAIVAFNVYTNYFNHIAETQIDFPTVELPEPATA